ARGTLPAVDVDAFVRGDWESADLLTIPTLSSARAGTDLQEGSPDAPMEWPVSEEGAFLSDGHGLDNPEELGMDGDEEMVLEWGGDDAGHITAGDDYSLSDDDAPAVDLVWKDATHSGWWTKVSYTCCLLVHVALTYPRKFRGFGFYIRGVSAHPGMSRIDRNSEPDTTTVSPKP
ncbi:unnamed protein product, partial [Symbiodinium necroappetens]